MKNIRKRIIVTICVLFVFGMIGIFFSARNKKIEGFENCITDIENVTIPEETKIVALGEATHGNREFQQLKLEVLKILVEKYDFRAFALEGDFGGCAVVNQYILEGKGTAKDAVFAIGFQIYRTQEMIDLVEWMREYNLSVSADEQIRFYGFDMQRTECSVTELADIFGKINSDSATDLVNRINTVFDENSKETVEDKKVVLQDMQSDLEQNKNQYLELLSATEYAYAKQYILCLMQGLELANAGADYSQLRDQFMAENVSAIIEIEKIYGNELVMLSGHNGHVAMKAMYRNMGEILEEQYGQEYCAVGTDFYNTSCNIANGNGRGNYHFCSKNPLAAQLKKQPSRKVFLDFAKANNESEVKSLLESPMKMGSLGESFTWYMYLLPQSYRINMVPEALYDSMILIYEATPTECLSE